MSAITRRDRLAWAAGFIDGEGSLWLGLTPSGAARISLSVTQVDRRPLDELKLLFGGGGVYVQHRATDLRRGTWQWKVSGGKSVVNVLDEIEHLLIVKREQAVIVREFVKTAGSGHAGRAVPSLRLRRRRQLIADLKASRAVI